jgi:hypothetical protein
VPNRAHLHAARPPPQDGEGSGDSSSGQDSDSDPAGAAAGGEGAGAAAAAGGGAGADKGGRKRGKGGGEYLKEGFVAYDDDFIDDSEVVMYKGSKRAKAKYSGFFVSTVGDAPDQIRSYQMLGCPHQIACSTRGRTAAATQV